jgi:hypothetical protein
MKNKQGFGDVPPLKKAHVNAGQAARNDFTNTLGDQDVVPNCGECAEFSTESGNVLLHDAWDPTDGLGR